MKNKFLLILVLFCNLSVSVSTCNGAVNLAKEKPYSVFPLQNYALSAPSTDTTALTDGRYSYGAFWTQKTTVGWRGTKTVEILIDLEKESNVGSITFNTARGSHAAVYYPTYISAFIGSDKDHLQYVGDLAVNIENKFGLYEVRKFELNDIHAQGRYVFLEVVPQGTFVFCDEIEVLEGSFIGKNRGTLTVEQAQTFTDQIRKTGIAELLNKQAGSLNNKEIAGGEIEQIKQQVLSLENMNDVEAVESKMLEFRRAALNVRFPGNEIIVQNIDTWAHQDTRICPDDASPFVFSFMLPKGGYASKAFSVTNLSSRAQNIGVSLNEPSLGVELAIYQVPFVKTAASEYVADPLVPVEKTFKLRPGETRMMFVTMHGAQSGTWNNSIHISSEDRVTSIPVTSIVTNVVIPQTLHINSINWGYLDFALIKERKKEAVEDLYSHHTNVLVVPIRYLPVSVTDDPYFLRLESYVKMHKGVTKVLLLGDFGSVRRSTVLDKYPFMGNEWKEWFSKWYVNLVLAVKRAGVKEDQIYFYPYDEMRGQQIDDFLRFAAWTKEAMPSVKFYATLGDGTYKSKRWGEILPYLDIAQASYDEMLADRSRFKGEAWIYSASAISRSLSPYSYYRLMPWKAFLRGYTGVGFWNYAEIGAINTTAWKEVDKDNDYTVIYEGKGTSIISSRRWEAWRMGLEDYELLTMYAKAKGDKAAKDLAATVFDDPENTSKADEVRHMILTELSGPEKERQ
ncbi:MAG: DUF4091 domain-containing protein [Chlorobium sp.]|nr:DUF4091 domain-containing protein [Chlorobium sp.]